MSDITRIDPKKSGPEQYAPPNRRTPKELSDVDQAVANAFEGENVSFLHRQRGEADPANEAKNLNELIRRVADASAEEIDQVILELQRVRDMLYNESERLNGEIARYASLNQHLMTGMKIITENLKQWKGASVSREQLVAEFKSRWLGGNLAD
jgi:hypothetical protein